MNTKLYYYNKVGIISGVLLLSCIDVAVITSLFVFSVGKNIGDWLGILLLIVMDSWLLLFVVLKQLIPALQNKFILEFNQTEVIYNYKHTKIEWKNVQSVEVTTVWPARLDVWYFDPQAEDSKRVMINLFLAGGNSRKIYANAMEYFDKANN